MVLFWRFRIVISDENTKSCIAKERERAEEGNYRGKKTV